MKPCLCPPQNGRPAAEAVAGGRPGGVLHGAVGQCPGQPGHPAPRLTLRGEPHQQGHTGPGSGLHAGHGPPAHGACSAHRAWGGGWLPRLQRDSGGHPGPQRCVRVSHQAGHRGNITRPLHSSAGQCCTDCSPVSSRPPASHCTTSSSAPGSAPPASPALTVLKPLSGEFPRVVSTGPFKGSGSRGTSALGPSVLFRIAVCCHVGKDSYFEFGMYG